MATYGTALVLLTLGALFLLAPHVIPDLTVPAATQMTPMGG